MKKSKGFSLVELIIVIAIMAILVGILAPNLMKNIEKSRESKDKNIVDNCATAVVNALAEPTAYDDLTFGEDGGISSTVAGLKTLGGTTWQNEYIDNLKNMDTQKFSSKKAGKNVVVGTCPVTIGADSSVTVSTPNGNITVSK